MTLSLTIHLWHVLAYLGVGVLSWFPLSWLVWLNTARPKAGFWKSLGYWWRSNGAPRALFAIAVQVVAWPLALWEELR